MVRKPFESEEYYQCDDLAKKAVREYLDKQEGFTQIKTEDYGPDIREVRFFHHEVEIKKDWIGGWPHRWKDVHIPERKKRLLEYKNLFFWIIAGDLEKAWVINGRRLLVEYLREIPNSKIQAGENMFCIPIKYCKLVRLK